MLLPYRNASSLLCGAQEEANMLHDKKGKKIRLGVDDLLSDTPMMSAWLTKPTLGLDVDVTGPTRIAPLVSCGGNM